MYTLAAAAIIALALIPIVIQRILHLPQMPAPNDVRNRRWRTPSLRRGSNVDAASSDALSHAWVGGVDRDPGNGAGVAEIAASAREATVEQCREGHRAEAAPEFVEATHRAMGYVRKESARNADEGRIGGTRT